MIFFIIDRAYPSLNLRLNVNSKQNEVDIVLPGLRYDDMDHFGKSDEMYTC